MASSTWNLRVEAKLLACSIYERCWLQWEPMIYHYMNRIQIWLVPCQNQQWHMPRVWAVKRSNALHVNYSRAARNTFHNSSLHILNIQVFLAIDGNLHVAVGLQNEVSKWAMHALKWSCMRVAWTWERSLWGANGGMSGGDSERSGFGGGMNGEGSKRSGFGGYEKQVWRVCVGLTASSGYDRWGYECLRWEIGEYEEENKLKVVGK